ncbi:hypothetical protein ACOSQ2_004623 [Xanthoceras sorbifolium]
MVGGFPRKEGMERKDVMSKNVSIYKAQASALEKHAAANCKAAKGILWRVWNLLELLYKFIIKTLKVTETTQKVKKCVDNAPVLWKMLKKQKMVKLELETERVYDEKKRVNGDGGSGGGKDENKGAKGNGGSDEGGR